MVSKKKNWIANPCTNAIDFEAARRNRERIADEQSRPISKQAGLQTRAEADKAFWKTPQWRRARYKALKLAGGRCQACGASAKDGIRLHVDHIKPRSKYPHLALRSKNLQVLCEDCNYGKGAWDDTDWRTS